MSALSLGILVGISATCVDLRGSNFLMSLQNSSTLTSLKRKCELSFAFLMAAIFGPCYLVNRC